MYNKGYASEAGPSTASTASMLTYRFSVGIMAVVADGKSVGENNDHVVKDVKDVSLDVAYL